MFSLVLPFHNDGSRLRATLDLLNASMAKYRIQEVLLCHNGQDNFVETQSLLSQYSGQSFRLIHTNTKGLGAGYKLGIENSTQEYCVLSASDLPFGFSDIESFFSHHRLFSEYPQIAVGSKAHPESLIDGYSLKRKLVSFGFWLFRAALLGAETPKDSQGTIIIKTEIAKALIKKSKYDDYFFSVELLTLGLKSGEHVIELPVRLENHDGQSSVSVVKDSHRMAKDLFEFSRRIREK